MTLLGNGFISHFLYLPIANLSIFMLTYFIIWAFPSKYEWNNLMMSWYHHLIVPWKYNTISNSASAVFTDWNNLQLENSSLKHSHSKHSSYPSYPKGVVYFIGFNSDLTTLRSLLCWLHLLKFLAFSLCSSNMKPLGTKCTSLYFGISAYALPQTFYSKSLFSEHLLSSFINHISYYVF